LTFARWSIELVFKELKRLYKLDVISSGASDIVESLVLVAMLTLVVSHRVLKPDTASGAGEEPAIYPPSLG
jgi:IS4 transposase